MLNALHLGHWSMAGLVNIFAHSYQRRMECGDL